MEDRGLFDEIMETLCSGREIEHKEAFTEGFIEALLWFMDIKGKRGYLVTLAGEVKKALKK